MTQAEILQIVEETKIVPVVKIDRVEDTIPLCQALIDGGLPIAEITFRTDAAEDAIKLAAKTFPNMLVGAGTIINVEQAKRAHAAGATFLVSPGFSKSVTQYAVDNNLPIFPGCATPTEIMAALEFNLPVVKFFPAKQFGGLNTLKAFAAAFPSVRFMPTGGIDASNINEHLAFNKIIACGGSWMVNGALVDAGNFDEIRRLTKEAMDTVNQ